MTNTVTAKTVTCCPTCGGEVAIRGNGTTHHYVAKKMFDCESCNHFITDVLSSRKCKLQKSPRYNIKTGKYQNLNCTQWS